MKNMQITLGDESIDSFIRELNMLKHDNNRVIRIGGKKDNPELMIVHKNFKIPKPQKKEQVDLISE